MRAPGSSLRKARVGGGHQPGPLREFFLPLKAVGINLAGAATPAHDYKVRGDGEEAPWQGCAALTATCQWLPNSKPSVTLTFPAQDTPPETWGQCGEEGALGGRARQAAGRTKKTSVPH